MASESGCHSIRWENDGKIATLRYMPDNLSISLQNQVGELGEEYETLKTGSSENALPEAAGTAAEDE